MPSPSFILIGLRGSGKSTIGRALAADLGWPFVDLDDLTPRELGCTSVAEAFERKGEPAFREAETAALRRAISQPSPRVIALGGGTPTAPGAAELLRIERDAGRVVVVYLCASAETLRERLATADNTHRPSLTGAPVLDEIGALLAKRDGLYRGLASETIDTDGLTDRAVVERLGRRG